MFHVRTGEPVVSRIRPSRRARWRRYAPAAALTLLGLAASLVPSYVTGGLGGLGIELTLFGTKLLLAIVAVLLIAGAMALLDEHPLVPLVAGALGLLIGINLAPRPWVLAPLVATGLVWTAGIEARRWLDGLTVRRDGVVLARPLRPPLEVPYDTIRAVHASPQVGPDGAIILETEHGTVTQTALPRCEDIQARIEARMHAVPVDPTAASLRDARQRIEKLAKRRGRTA